MARNTRTPARILIVTTSTPAYETAGYRTGLWLSELTHFYDVVVEAGHDVTIASIDGGLVPLDPESLSLPMLAMGGTKRRYRDASFMDLLDQTPTLEDVADQDWDAIYLTGGHGTMFDFPHHEVLGSILATTLEDGGVIAAVCHGPAGFVGARLSDGSPLVAGRHVTGFSWPEEKLAKRDKAVPFRLDKALKAEGAKYTQALLPMAEKVVVDGVLVTGQNPTSAAGVGKAVVKLLKKNRVASR
ncbi:MAG TPA: type 1 glutamine amidotransferase domain-containing protein [Intrasporangiaceae bacterium]|nr:type 1 glutamine amidotransferase domain-containing protein [Intrasporangiaceae bacterium]